MNSTSVITWLLSVLRGDKIIWLVVFLIGLISLLAVYSSTSALAFKFQDGNTEYYLIKHFILLGVGFGVMYVVHLFDYRIFAKLSTFLLVISIPLLIYTLMQGDEAKVNDANRWIRIFGQSFQPSDLAKLALMIFLAKILTQRQEVLDDFKKGFLNILAWVGVVCIFIAPADLSTTLLIFVTSLMLMFIAGVRLKFILGLIVTGSMLIWIAFATVPRARTWEARMNDWWTMVTDPSAEVDYQPAQAFNAIASGGIVGKGVGKSTQRNFLPQAYSDYVYAIIIEEYGLLGGVLVLALYMILLIRGVGIVTMSKTFGALLAAGLSFMLCLQAMINMAVAVGLFPVTGLPLPMLSMGGTSIIFTGISFGIILSVSRTAIDNKKKVENQAAGDALPAMA